MAKPVASALRKEDIIQRLEEIVTLIDQSARWALQRRAVMEAGNQILANLNVSHGMLSYNILHQTLVRSLVLDVTSCFDWSKKYPPERQSKASIEALYYYITREGIADIFLERARNFSSVIGNQHEEDCREALARISQNHANCSQDPEFQRRLLTLRHLRDQRIAHNQFGTTPHAPTYAELFQLLDVAKQFSADGLLAVLGRGQDYEGFEQSAARSARDLWTRALAAGSISAIEPIVLPRHVDNE